jgi:Mrp family chromosome partitioning ATPase/capsular polysaccharide biosynthesis protein
MVDVSRRRAPLRGPRERSLLRAQARWILTVTLVAVAGALVLAWALHDPGYRSQVQVVVTPAFAPSGAPLPTNMETERQIVLSRTIASLAAETTGTSPGQLQRGLSATVPAGTTVLVLEYEDHTADAARRNAQAIADAYTVYRGGQAAVLSRATAPRSTTSPPYLVDAAAGLALGLLVGIGSALLRDRRDDRLRGPEDFFRQTDLPVLVTVPAQQGQDDLAVLDDPWSPAAEAYRQLRGKIARVARGHDGTTAITLFTSAAGEADAAWAAANTAAAMAVGGSRVLLVEADLRRTGDGGSSDGPPDLGLSEVVAGHVPLLEAVSTGRVEHLMLLRAGSGTPVPPADLLDEASMDRLLGQVPADVDHVVVHAPPVLLAAETSTMAEHADLVVLVAATDGTCRQDLRTAVTELRAGDAALLGGVLVIPPRRRSETPGPSGSPGATDASRPDPHEVGAHRAAKEPYAEQPNADVVTASDE